MKFQRQKLRTIIKFTAASLLFLLSTILLSSALALYVFSGLLLSPKTPLIAEEVIEDYGPTLIEEAQPHLTEYFTDERSKKWVKAVEQSPESLSYTLSTNGFFTWSSAEFSSLIRSLQTSLSSPRSTPLVLDTAGLDASLKHPQTRTFLMSVISQLPPCSQREMLDWRTFAFDPTKGDMPSCNPNEALVTSMVVDYALNSKLNIPDEFHLSDEVQLPDLILPPAHIVTVAIVLTLLLSLLGLYAAFSLISRSPQKRIQFLGITLLCSGGVYLFFGIIARILYLDPAIVVAHPYITSHENYHVIADAPSLLEAGSYILASLQGIISSRFLVSAAALFAVGTAALLLKKKVKTRF